MTDREQEDGCPFCCLPADRVVLHNHNAVAIADAFPVSPGHMLVLPRRHVADFFELEREEMGAVLDLVVQAKRRLDAQHFPDGYNVGINTGPSAGQTVWHAHVHLIPRYDRDVPDPRGGVRNVIPGKGSY